MAGANKNQTKAAKAVSGAKAAGATVSVGEGLRLLTPLNGGKHAYVNSGGRSVHVATNGDAFLRRRARPGRQRPGGPGPQRAGTARPGVPAVGVAVGMRPGRGRAVRPGREHRRRRRRGRLPELAARSSAQVIRRGRAARDRSDRWRPAWPPRLKEPCSCSAAVNGRVRARARVRGRRSPGAGCNCPGNCR